MSIETSQQSIPNFQELKEQYKKRLDEILYKELTVENIDTFADEALEKLVSLTSDILEQDKTNIEFGPQPDTQRQEDDAYKRFDLPNIQEILGRVNEVRNHIENLKDYVAHHKQFVDTIITPPMEDFEINGGSGTGIKEKKIIPRLITLLYILETDLDIKKESVIVTEGEVTPNMMRKTPYVRVEIPDIDRLVYLCDEEGNASYVFDTEKLKELHISFNELDIDDKSDKNSLITKHPGIGIRLIHEYAGRNWRRNMAKLLSEPIPQRKVTFKDSTEEFEKRSVQEQRSEFAEGKEPIPFETLREQFRAVYPGEISVAKFYAKERRNHIREWVSNPPKVYKNKGWIDWSDFGGKENPKKKKFLPLETLSKQVSSLYPGKGNKAAFYRKERENHNDWPSNPDKLKAYRGKWKSYDSLISED